MNLITLGGLELTEVDFARPKPLLLLTYLALEGTKDRRYLAELFWPDATAPLNSLAAALKQLRHYTPGVVESDATRVSSTVSCDARTLLQVADAGDYAGVRELYRGPFLNGVYLPGWSAELEEWVYGTREFLAGRARSALLRLGEDVAANGKFKDAAKFAETALLLPGAPELEPEELTRFHALLAAGDSPHLGRLRKDALSLGIKLFLSAAEARERLRCPPADFSSGISEGNLPVRGTSFIGRDAELVEIANQLAKPDCSLLTLTGPGGVGKSRLAVGAARNLSDRFDDGVYFVPLDALHDASLVASSIAGALSLSLQGGEDPLSQVARFIGNKAALLVLDNYEHLLETASVVARLLHDCPNLKVLVTSRERLNLEEEWVLVLDGIMVPPRTISPPNYAQNDALQLFEDRAKRARLSFELTPQELSYVVSICEQVQGLPLGIELAAAWVKILSCKEIAQEIVQTTDFLAANNRNIPERHKSLRAVFEHSWRLLSFNEQGALRKLSVFQGGFKREAAAEVVGVTIPVLASLVDKSLLRVSPSGRYDRHSLIYQYTQEKLAEHLEEEARTREHHARYYLRFLEARSADLTGSRQHEVLLVMAEELSNIRAAWAWAVKAKSVEDLRRCASTLSLFYEISGRFHEGVASFGAAVAAFEGASPKYRGILSHMLLEYACHNYRLCRFIQATHASERGLELARASCDDELIARHLNSLGQIAWQVGECASSIQYLEEALALARKGSDEVLRADLIRSIGWVENKRGNYLIAKKYLQNALMLFRQMKMPHDVVNNLNALGHLYVNTGLPNEAQPFFEEGLKLAKETGAQLMVPHLLSGTGLALFELGKFSEARTVLERSMHESANELAQAWVLVVLGRVATAIANYPLAQHYIEQALATSWSTRQLPEVLDALVAFSELCIKQGQEAQAALTLRIAFTHSATTGYSRALAQKLLASLGNPLALTSVDTSEVDGAQTLLEEVVTQVLG